MWLNMLSSRHGLVGVRTSSHADVLASTSSGWLVSWWYFNVSVRPPSSCQHHQTCCYMVLVGSFCSSQALTQSDRKKFAAASLGALYQLVIQGAQTMRGDVAFRELFGPLQSVALKVRVSLFSGCPSSNRFMHISCHAAILLWNNTVMFSFPAANSHASTLLSSRFSRLRHLRYHKLYKSSTCSCQSSSPRPRRR